MMALMDFKPRLKPGRMTPHGSKFTFRIEEPSEQVTLPMIMADFILLCSGQYTLREIIEKIYRKQGSVPFRALLETLYDLHSRGFLENSEEFEPASWQTKFKAKLKLHYDVLFKGRLLGPGPTIIAFYLTSVTTILLSMYEVVAGFEDGLNLSVDTLNLTFCATVFALSSIILSLRNALRGLQILTLKGWVEQFSFRLAPWGLYFNVGDQLTDQNHNQFYPVLFHLSQLVSPFAMALAVKPFSLQLANTVFLLASVLVYWDMNPFRPTNVYEALRTMLLPHQLDSMAFVGSGFNPRTRKFAFVRAALGILWIVCGISFLAMTADFNVNQLIAVLKDQGASEKIAALIGFGFWFGFLFYLVHTFVETLSSLITEESRLKELRSKAKSVLLPETLSYEKLIERLKPLPLFTHLSDEGLHELVKNSELFSAAPESVIIEEGSYSTDLFVLLDGSVSVDRNGFVGQIFPTTIFGESALMESGTRSANVTATEKSLALRIPISVLNKVARESDVIGKVEGFTTAIMVDQFFASSELFRRLPRDIVEFLSSRGALEFVSPDFIVFQQGDPGDYFYMVIRGSMQVLINDRAVKVIPQGGFFGEISIIANIPRTGTIKALEPSVLFKISSESFWEVLLQHIEMAVFMETVGEQRLQEDLQLMQLGKSA